MNNILDLEEARLKKQARLKISKLDENIQELRIVNKVISDAILGLTTYDKYISVKKVLDDLFILHSDIRRAIVNKEEVLERLQNEQD